jgi:hypothetical protein
VNEAKARPEASMKKTLFMLLSLERVDVTGKLINAWINILRKPL